MFLRRKTLFSTRKSLLSSKMSFKNPLKIKKEENELLNEPFIKEIRKTNIKFYSFKLTENQQNSKNINSQYCNLQKMNLNHQSIFPNVKNQERLKEETARDAELQSFCKSINETLFATNFLHLLK